jgi:hypothetical protein
MIEKTHFLSFSLMVKLPLTCIPEELLPITWLIEDDFFFSLIKLATAVRKAPKLTKKASREASP